MLTYQSQFSEFGTTASAQRWMNNLIRQSSPALILLPGLWLFFGRRSEGSHAPCRVRYWPFAAFFFIPLGILLLRKINSPADHYTLPLAAALAANVSILLPQLLRSWHPFLQKCVRRQHVQLLVGVVTIFTMQALGSFRLEEVSARFQSIYKQRMIASETYGVAKQLFSEAQVVAGGLVPVPRELAGLRQQGHYGITLKNLSDTSIDFIFINKKTTKSLLEEETPDKYFGFDGRPSYLSLREVYSLFYQTERFTTKEGVTWRLVFSDENGAQIWKRQG